MYIFTLLLIFIFGVDTKIEILSESEIQSTISLSRCLLEASKIYFSHLTFILPREETQQILNPMPLNNLLLSSLGIDQNVTYFVRNLDEESATELTNMETQNCIIQIRDMDGFEDIIIKLTRATHWKSNSKLLVISKIGVHDPQTLAEKILKILQEKEIMNCVILLPDLAIPTNYTVYGPFSSNEARCGGVYKPLVIDSCSYGTFTGNQFWFLERGEERMKGCEIKVNYLNWAPYAMNVEDSYQRSSYWINQGLEVNLLNMLGTLLDFKIVYSRSTTWGNVLENGSTTGDFTLLKNKTADILIGAYSITYSRSLYLETSVSYILEGLQWCVPHAPIWDGIKLGQPVVWLLIVLIYITLVIPLWLVSRRNSAELASYKNLASTLIVTFGVILGISPKDLPKTRKSKYFMTLLIFLGYYASTLYTSVLTSEVMRPGFEEKYSSMKDIYIHNLSTYFAINTLRYFEGNMINGVPKSVIESKAIYCHNITMCLDSVASGVSAYLCPTHPSTFIQKRVIRGKRMHCFAYSSVGVPIAMMMRKGFPFKDSFNTLIHRILSAGFLVKWERDILQSFDEGGDRTNGVKMENLREIFNMMVLGHLVSCGVFIIEIHFCVNKRNKINIK
ncbi:uncharacterized protein [Leptinotarsa decemlineata]|uniref:uncharacterized protein n=1 Tax=Leptinotarsa decemlineata TaxID=7539 RepID=UPI003D308C58